MRRESGTGVEPPNPGLIDCQDRRYSHLQWQNIVRLALRNFVTSVTIAQSCEFKEKFQLREKIDPTCLHK